MIKRVILIILMIVAMATFVCAEGIDANTKLMLHMDDAGLSDSSDSSHSVTLNGDTTRSAAQSKFGGYSAYFDGMGDYLSVPDSDDWDFGTGDFTIDLWANFKDNNNYRGLLFHGTDADNRWILSYNIETNNKLRFSTEISGSYMGYDSNSWTPTLDNWYHIAIVRNGNNLSFYVDGQFFGQHTFSTNLNGFTDNIFIGAYKDNVYALRTANVFNGSIDELRISKGIARWTSDFTPPTAPYSAAPLAPFSCGDTISYEGQDYNTVLIGEQCWFAENLNVGTKVTGVTTQTNNDILEKYCYSDDEAICTTDGALYQWDEMMQYVTTEGAQGICPSDWHIPTDAEWYTLENGFATGSCIASRSGYDCNPAGTELRLGGTSGFEGLLSGRRNPVGTFYGLDYGIYFWTSTATSNAWLRRWLSDLTTVNRDFDNKEYGFSVRCLQNPSTTPTSSNFTSTETTNFSAVDVTNVTSMTLAIIGKGKIKFSESTEINAENQDYDTNIIIEDGFISVDTAALDPSFNTSATITLEGVTCPVATITYQEGTFTSKDDIIAGGKNCELDGVCSNVLCAGTTLTFDVAHFTGFAAGADANLTTEAEAGIFYPLDLIEFTAEYINSTSGTPISGECNITFDDEGTWYTMDFDSTDYNYTKSFAAAGTHDYNVTCSSANFVTLEANDTKLVSSVDIPEFSVLTLGLGLIAVLVGLVIIRKK